MPSASLQGWRTDRSEELNAIEHAHGVAVARAAGRRWIARQLIHSYTLILSAHFQGFARDLHSEVVGHLVAAVSPATLRSVLRVELTFARRLDRGNPNPGGIGSDFDRLGLGFWPAVRAADVRNLRRQEKLEHLCAWRNAIAHQDFHSALPSPSSLQLRTLRTWRRACDRLAYSFDGVMRAHITTLTGVEPW